MIQYKALAIGSGATVSAAFNVPVNIKQVVVLIPDIDAGDVGLEASMNAGGNYYPVMDDVDGSDVVVNASGKDPGWTDITKWLKAFASAKDFLCRFTCVAQQSGAVTAHLFIVKGTKE